VRNKYAKINLYLTPELYEATDAAVILESRPVSVGDWIRRRMKEAFEDKDPEVQTKKAKKKLRYLVSNQTLEELSDQFGIPVARLKAILGDE